MSNKTFVKDSLVNAIKALSVDAIEKANSGHPGMPMGVAEVAATLWADHYVNDPKAPDWFDRDRFVLSSGHASMLLYSLLHLAGFDLSLDDLKAFRQLDSRTPGHPEFGMTPGVETTTGPLGQGLATAVGMAMAEAHLAARFNRPGLTVVDHKTWVICSDGDLHEGISLEAGNLAGHLGLGKLIVLYDSNDITIEGKTSLAWSEDVPMRFQALGWHTETVDGYDQKALQAAIERAEAETERPSIIVCKTVIGRGAPSKAGSPGSHGSPLGQKELAGFKASIGWPESPDFYVPEDAYEAFSGLRSRSEQKRLAWEADLKRYEERFPDLAKTFFRLIKKEGADLPGGLPEGLFEHLPAFDDSPIATRSSSGKVINALAPHLPELWGGSADLAASTKTLMDGESSFSKDNRLGRNLHFGIREHGMAAALNGIALHGGLIPYGATFLTFSDYMRGAMRLSALMGTRVIYVLTHDSIFLGEDGPTHQSIEHAMALRLIPGLTVMRPADARECAEAWKFALQHNGPTCLLLSRQNLRGLPNTGPGLEKGAYVIMDSDEPEIALIGTGSELALCVDAAEILREKGRRVRVVSMPSMERFLQLSKDEQEAVLPSSLKCRLSVEAGRSLGWEAIVGRDGEIIGIDSFGASAPAEILASHFGFTVENVVARAEALLEKML